MRIEYIAFMAAALFAWAALAAAEPIEQTRYGRAVMRFEGRPQPQSVQNAAQRQMRERDLARAGVQARWIQLVDNEGGPLINNPYIPCDYPEADDNEAILKQWVADMHEAGMCVMSWYPLTFCKSGWRAHPDWRQVYIVPWRPEDFCCCIETGYGDALIDYCNYAIDRLGLDGIWFDGSVWTPIWERPVPLTCRCEACRARFRADTGLEVPDELHWESDTFRKWVAWRYGEFGGYIGRLAGAIREKHPDAAVVINHYHRPGIPWQSAVPIDRYSADIISGSEAFSPDTLDLTMRLCRAYGRSESEVWRPFTMAGEPEEAAEALLQHALICYNVGGDPSFGGDLFDPKVPLTAALMTPIMEAIHPFVGGAALPYAAFHVSQQTETFFFGRGGAGASPVEPYWDSLGLWTRGLGEAHIPPEYVYDADLVPQTLAPYRVLFMPLSLALTDAQARTVLAYARAGGTVILGIAAGNLDATGEPRAANALGEALGFAFSGTPRPDGSDCEVVRLVPAQDGEEAEPRVAAPIVVSGMRTPLRLRGDEWKVLLRSGDGPGAPPGVATRAFGKGRVLVLDMDPSATFGTTPVLGGNTELHVTDETAAGGKYSLKYVDDPIAPQPFYPDLENKLPPFGTPEYVGGELSCDLRVGTDAHVSVEIRSTLEPIPGPIVQLGPDGKIRADGQPVCDLPLDTWLHLRIAYAFASAGKPAAYGVTVALPGGEEHRATAACSAPQWHRTDWLVIYGAGTKPATFYLDNLMLEGIRADGSRRTALRLDFEGGPTALQPGTTLVRAIAELTKQYAPPPMRVEAPDYVRIGAFERDGGRRLLVHLHNRNGRRADWQQDIGAPATLSCDFRVRSARSALTGKPMPVTQRAGRYDVQVAAVGLYDVIEISR